MRAIALVCLPVALALTAAACSELPPIAEGQCGNGILEESEDCDNSTVLCVQCALKCADARNCPAGYSCGVDDFCHAASGVFETEERSSFAFPSIGFRTTDVDRDGIGDVVGLNPTALNVRYGDPSGDLSNQYNVVTPLVLGLPALTHLVDEDTDDLVLPTADGLVAYTAAFGIPSPRQFPLGGGQTMMGDAPNPFDGVQVFDTLGLFGPTSEASGAPLAFGVYELTNRGPIFDALTVAPCGSVEIADPIKWQHGEVVRYATADATFLAFTYTRTCVLMVRRAGPTADDPGEGSCPPFRTDKCQFEIVNLTGPSFPALAGTLVFARLDADACPSLVSQDSSGLLSEYVGTGTAADCVLTATPSVSGLPTFADQVIGSVPIVPADGGLQPDAIVGSFGIQGLTTAGVWQTMYLSDRPMERIVAGDINTDGAIDAVLTTSQSNLDIARRVVGQPTFLLVRTPTTGAVDHATIGDFDGDQRDDLAYVENLGTAERLSIAYGADDGLAPGVPADAFSNVELMAPIQVSDSTDPFRLVDDLIAIDVLPTTPPSAEITVLHGSPSRTMLSFYGPPQPVNGTPFRGVVAGDFVDTGQSESHIDLVALQRTSLGETAIWIIPGLPNGRLGDAVRPGVNAPLPTTAEIGECSFAPGDPTFCLGFAAYAGFPVVPSGETASHEVVLAVDFKAGATPKLMRMDPADPTSLTFSEPFRAGGRVFTLETIDLDDDDLPELFAAFTPLTPFTGDGHVALCHMQRNGMPALCQDVATDILGDPALECLDATRGRIERRCSIDDSDEAGAPRHKLVVLCRKDGLAYAIPITAPGGTFEGRLDDAVITTQKLLGLIQLGDVTGDKVDDLLALDVSNGIATMNVFRQLPIRETDRCYAQ